PARARGRGLLRRARARRLSRHAHAKLGSRLGRHRNWAGWTAACEPVGYLSIRSARSSGAGLTIEKGSSPCVRWGLPSHFCSSAAEPTERPPILRSPIRLAPARAERP